MAIHARFRRPLASLGALLVFGAATAGAVAPASANATFTLTRVAGADRYATAAALAGDAFTSATTAVIARGDGFADALGGAYLAGILPAGAPVLLTQTATVPQATKSRLASLGVRTVYLLGGTAAISDAAERDLATSYTVNRIAGTNRYDTAAQVARQPNTQGIGNLNNQRTAIVVSGEAFPDALAAGPLAFSQRFPILLTRAGALPPESSAAITALAIRRVIVVGGANAINESVVNQLNALGATTERVAGNDRYATATTLADFALARITGWSAATIDLATGQNFADALAGGSAAGRATRSILLTTSTSLSVATSNWLRAHASSVASGRVYGGTSAVSDGTLAAAIQAGRAATGASSGAVTGTDKNSNRYTYLAGSTPTSVTYQAADTFVVDGRSSTLAAFETALSSNDAIAYTAAAGSTPARHELTNQAPPSQAGQAVAGLTADGDNRGSTPSATDGGSFTMAITGGTSVTTYRAAIAGDSFLVNGAAATEAAFEQSYSAGDDVTFRAADAGSGSGQVVQLVDRALAGAVSRSSVNTANSTAQGNPANSYAVLARNGTTELQTVVYSNAASAGTDRYFVNGASATLAAFETSLNQVDAGTRTGTVDVDRTGSGASLVETHRLVTR